MNHKMRRPVAERVARLILPPRDEVTASEGTDWVYAEWHAGPHRGATRVLELRGRLVGQTTVTVRMTDAVRANPNVVPLRLDGLRVGPLQSLAGALPEDDVFVRFDGDEVRAEGGESGAAERDVVREMPVRVPAPEVSLCLVAARVAGTDTVDVEHFGGKPDRFNVRTVPGLRGVVDIDSMVGREWYLYSLGDEVLAIEPRDILRAGAPHRTFVGLSSFLRRHNWRTQGHLAVVDSAGAEAPTPAEGDVALVLHAFGSTRYKPFLVPGHFSLGRAAVVRCPISGDLRYDLVYHQVYAHNQNALVSCSQTWATYRGDLRSGWHSHMPVSDALVFTPYMLECDGAPLRILRHQLEVVMARYRTGDGTGVSSVTPSTSCVQDTTQAVFLSLLRGQSEIEDVECRRRLAGLVKEIREQLGDRIRPDWENNALVLEGTDYQKKLRYGLLSWRTMFPRTAFDRYCRVFRGTPMVFVRDDGFVDSAPKPGRPTPPTALLGEVPFASELLRRPLMAAIDEPGVWAVAALALLALATRVASGRGALTLLFTVMAVPHASDNEFPTAPFALLAAAALWYFTGRLSEAALPAVYALDGSVVTLVLAQGVLSRAEELLRPKKL